MTISTDEIGRWISDDRNHGVNINSGVLSDMCCEIIRTRAKLEAAEKLAEAAKSLVNSGINPADLVAALAAYEAAQ